MLISFIDFCPLFSFENLFNTHQSFFVVAQNTPISPTHKASPLANWVAWMSR